MRTSPHFRRQAESVYTIRRHRRFLITALVVVVGLSLVSTWLGTTVRPPGAVDLELGAFARVIGASGSASSAAISDSALITDGATFATVGETVTVHFGSGTESRGIVRALRTTVDALPVAVVTLLDGAITPASLLTASYSGNEGQRGLVVCVADDGTVRYERLRLPGEQDELPATVHECGPGGALVADAEGSDLLALVVLGRGARLRLIPMEQIQLP